MSETNKVILAAILGILVGFGGGRLLQNRAVGGPVTKSDVSASEAAATQSTPSDVSPTAPAVKETTVSTDSPVTATVETAPVVKQAEASADSVSVGDQKAGTMVLASATLTKTGWVVVHEDRDGMPGNVLGARRMEMGTGSIEIMLLRATSPENKYYVMLHDDDGDRQFDLHKDMPLKNSAGNAIMASFVAE